MNVRGVDYPVSTSSAPNTQGDLVRRADVEAPGIALSVSGASAHVRADLSDWQQVLAFESAATDLRLSPRLKDRFAVEDFGCTPNAYHQALVYAIELPEAVMYAPALVARLRRLRDARRAVRHVTSERAPSPRSGQRTLALRGGW